MINERSQVCCVNFYASVINGSVALETLQTLLRDQIEQLLLQCHPRR